MIEQLSGKVYIDTLLSGEKWGAATYGKSATVTYSFTTPDSVFTQNYGNEPLNGFQPLTLAQTQAVRQAIQSIAQVANITFQEITESGPTYGQIRFGRSNEVDDSGALAYAYYPGSAAWSGDVWFGYGSDLNDVSKGSYGYETIIHEIGHAIGLKHPFDTDGPGGVAPQEIDNSYYTVMSYTGAYTGASTLMLDDIATLQYMYGPNLNTRPGNTAYSWPRGATILETIWDAGGRDTLRWTNQTTSVELNLQDGRFSRYKSGFYSGKRFLAIAYNTLIENAEGGSGNDLLLGNGQNNVLDGNQGADQLIGKGGKDTLIGDLGNDTLTGGSGGDRFTFDMGSTFNKGIGVDTITDFDVNADQIVLDTSTFTDLKPVLSFLSVNSVEQAQASRAQITYLRSTGMLYYNANQAETGFGTGGAFAKLTANLGLTADHFAVIA